MGSACEKDKSQFLELSKWLMFIILENDLTYLCGSVVQPIRLENFLLKF